MTPTPEMRSVQREQKAIKLPDMPEPLTLREQAAIAAMQGIISNNRYNGGTDIVAETAVRYADALIKQLQGNG